MQAHMNPDMMHLCRRHHTFAPCPTHSYPPLESVDSSYAPWLFNQGSASYGLFGLALNQNAAAAAAAAAATDERKPIFGPEAIQQSLETEIPAGALDKGVLTPELSPQMLSTSPQSDDDEVEERPYKRQRTGSKAKRSNSPVLRSDGVRKKNAKFEIPDGRNIGNIDRLIMQADNEDLRKELKTQRRLLKNREAALLSRQRKKQHTEHLEGERKDLIASLNNLRSENENLKGRGDNNDSELAALRAHELESEARIGRLQMEKEKMAATHAKEVSELRAKLAMMSDGLQATSPISTAPSSLWSGATEPSSYSISTDNDDESAYWGQHASEWSLVNEYCMEDESVLGSPIFSKNVVYDQKREHRQPDALMAVLLLGAHTVYKKTKKNRAVEVPPAVQVAARGVLHNAYLEAKLSLSIDFPMPTGAATPAANDQLWQAAASLVKGNITRDTIRDFQNFVKPVSAQPLIKTE